MSLSVGIVGLPNVGKSTLFNALLQKQQALAANYPFATVDPNVGVVPVEDERLEKLVKVTGTKKVVPATVNFTDIAGLVKGAHKGEGLGNKFLSHIREVNLICHVLRSFEDKDVVQTSNLDPVEDFLTVETELQLADLASLEKQKETKGKASREEEKRWEVVKKMKEALEKGISAREVELNEDEDVIRKELFLLTAKPVLVVVNIGESEIKKTREVGEEMLRRMKEKGIKMEKEQVVVICAKMEEELVDFKGEEKKVYLEEMKVKEMGLEQLSRKAYVHLGLISFLTTGVDEVRAWAVRQGAKAPEAAGVIHSDFEKKFIKVKVCKFDDFIAENGWKGAAEKGKMRLEGKEYEIKEGDVVEFMAGS